MDISLTINGLDLHKKLSTYVLEREVSYREIITTLDDVEHPYPGTQKSIISFSLLPMTDAESVELYKALSSLVFNATYTNPYTGTEETKRVRLTSDLESKFALLSVDGKRRYKGGTIQIREL